MKRTLLLLLAAALTCAAVAQAPKLESLTFPEKDAGKVYVLAKSAYECGKLQGYKQMVTDTGRAWGEDRRRSVMATINKGWSTLGCDGWLKVIDELGKIRRTP